MIITNDLLLYTINVHNAHSSSIFSHLCLEIKSFLNVCDLSAHNAGERIKPPIHHYHKPTCEQHEAFMSK